MFPHVVLGTDISICLNLSQITYTVSENYTKFDKKLQSYKYDVHYRSFSASTFSKYQKILTPKSLL